MMLPPNPPLPTPKYFPFQPDTGSQTSNSMWESLEGCITPWMRQNAGSFSRSLTAAADAGGDGLKAPTATTWAAVIVVAGIFKAAMLSHVAPNAGAVTK